MSSLPNISGRAVYRIRIAGRVGNGWGDFMIDGQETVAWEGGEVTTVVTGVFADQAALFGLLCRVRDRGLVLVSVECLAQAGGAAPAAKRSPADPIGPDDPPTGHQRVSSEKES